LRFIEKWVHSKYSTTLNEIIESETKRVDSLYTESQKKAADLNLPLRVVLELNRYEQQKKNANSLAYLNDSDIPSPTRIELAVIGMCNERPAKGQFGITFQLIEHLRQIFKDFPTTKYLWAIYSDYQQKQAKIQFRDEIKKEKIIRFFYTMATFSAYMLLGIIVYFYFKKYATRIISNYLKLQNTNPQQKIIIGIISPILLILFALFIQTSIFEMSDYEIYKNYFLWFIIGLIILFFEMKLFETPKNED